MDRRSFLRLLSVAPVVGAPPGPLDAQSRAASSPDVELVLTAEPSQLNLLPGAPTPVWRYSGRIVRGPASTLQTIEGSSLGPIIRLRRGQHARIRFINRIGEPSIVHWHGLDVPEHADGHPRLAIGHGAEYVYDFQVTNRAGTYWYHPHPHQRTGFQVYQGLAGLLVVSDPEEEALGLPAGADEIPCVLQDRRFDAGNRLLYLDAPPGAARGMMGRGGPMMRGGMGGQMMNAVNGWLGDRMLVNGRLQPRREVGRRTYRVRLLNGSNARIYKLAWSDRSPMTVIGGDGGLLERPRTVRSLTLAPAQRADVLLDLSGHARGSQVHLQSLAYPAAHAGMAGMMGMMGDTSPLPQGAPLTLMTLSVSGAAGPRVRTPETLSRHEFREAASAPLRRVPLSFGAMTWFIDGRVFDMTDVADVETVAAGSTHTWEFVNEPGAMGMEMAHPIHIHGRQFRVLQRTGGSANALREGIVDAGWIDTVLVLPGERVRTQITFSRNPGLYLYHCHLLEHEDMGMMRNFRVRR